ncbi:MAG TPA: class I SAM-dependent methyltransferase [Aggregatilineales bacterium]|nr:class I SAM-dependent methyltransferase [Aggregatilineales bacterium]
MGISQQGQFWDSVTEAAAPLVEARRLIEALVPAAAIGDVLDAGCGAGDYSAAFTALGARRVAGFDVSAGSLRLARKRTPSGHFSQASLTHLPFPDQTFDVVWSWGVLHYVPDPVLALHEVTRVLRPGGVAVIHTLRAGFWSSLERTGAQVMCHTPGWVQPIMLSAGERLIPPLSQLITGRRPEELTSKTIRQKLHERLFVPGTTYTFSVEQLVLAFGSTMDTTEAHPPVADLLKRDMSVTVVGRRKA